MISEYKKIPVFDFVVGEKEKEFINDCLNKSMIGQGFYVKEFEKKFSQFVDCEYGITTTSGTTALHLMCKCIVPSTWAIIVTAKFDSSTSTC